MSAKNNEILCQREAVGHRLVELFSVGGRENNFIVVAFCLQSIDATLDGFYFHNHSGKPSKRIIIDTAIFIFGIITQIVNMYLCKSFILSSFHDRTIEETFNHFG